MNCIMGTIAGDDTILIILRENCQRQDVINELSEAIPAIKSILL